MFRRRSDLPLDGDPSSRFTPWLIALMVYLATLAVAAGLMVGTMIDTWQTGVTHTLTVQIPPLSSPGQTDKAAATVITRLEDFNNIAHATRVGDADMRALLEPWLGTGVKAGDLPMPVLIDVELIGGAHFDLVALAKQLDAVAPGISIDDHGVWLDRLVRLARSVEWVSYGVVLLIIGATVGTVIFATRTGLAIHRKVIEVLHLIGAQDSYIAGQFGHHAMVLGLKGGALGLGLAAPTLILLAVLSSRLDSQLMPQFSLSLNQWLVLASIPLAAAAVARATAFVTVNRTLRRLI